MSEKTIQVKCKGADVLPIDVIFDFQGGLKKLSKANLTRLKKRIVEDGFIAPFFVWNDAGDNKLLDGHQRLAAVLSLREEGYDLPLFPVVYIEAADEQEARRRLLSITSQYGEFVIEELDEWFKGFDEELKNSFRFVDKEIKVSLNEDNQYSRKITSPVYEPKNEKPKINELYDESKTSQLIEEINKTEIEEDEKTFLIAAARRHTIFNYRSIADFYAHSNKKIQELMEDRKSVV